MYTTALIDTSANPLVAREADVWALHERIIKPPGKLDGKHGEAIASCKRPSIQPRLR